MKHNKRGRVAIYYKNFLPLKLIDANHLIESILLGSNWFQHM